ncbi:formimidoylglutamate deiminase [Gluconacetobacter tumulisoli]|nr:formimidoylglutamate deiminase [Gluconacetobacter tumulisoli]
MTMDRTTVGFAGQALLPGGWHDNVRIVTDAGRIAVVEPGGDPKGADWRTDIVIPPMPSLHSHAFQRAMAGMTETRQNPTDTFWTWRTLMYRLALRLSPDQMEIVAAFLYMEMLCAGYTQVAEFHYLHHAPDGTPYDRKAEMSLRLLAAAQGVGMGITILPTLYAQAGFNAAPLQSDQRRFATDVEMIGAIAADLRRASAGDPLVTVGLGFHSLRAVTADAMRRALAEPGHDGPIHIHVAEQQREVADSLSATGRRPVAFLMDEIPVDARWCLVHATHLDADETARMAASGAVAGLCPITEADLGDGLFPLRDFLDAGGRFGIGTDSNVLISPGEELRLLEYGQRLGRQQRCVSLPSGRTGSVGGYLYRAALQGGAQACGLPAWGLAPGARADLCVLDADRLPLPGLKGDAILDAALFASPRLPVRDVMCAGAWRVRDGRHADHDRLTQAFRTTVTAVLAD